MTTEEATRITAEIVEDDPERVSVYFKWNPRVWAHGIQASIFDGQVHLWLHLEDARELHRQLDEALNKQDFADAGHPPFERVQEEADVRREEIKNR